MKAHEFLKNINIETHSNYLMSRDKFIIYFHNYIKSKKLIIESGSEYPRNMCNVDTNIQKLFSLVDITLLTYNEFNKQLCKLFISTKYFIP